jgi:hypothetical protein
VDGEFERGKCKMAHRSETNRIPWEVARDTDTIVTGPLTPERGALDVTLESAVHNVPKKEVPCNRKAEEYAQTPNDAPLKDKVLLPVEVKELPMNAISLGAKYDA